MKRHSATAAVMEQRLRRQWAQNMFFMCAAALLAVAQLHSGVSAQVLGAAVFGSIAAIFSAATQHGEGMSELEYCERSAPLYGRELARAIALVPCSGAAAALTVYWLIAAASGGPHAAGVLLSYACAFAAALVALCATVRSGVLALLYVCLAAAIVAGIIALGSEQLAAAILCSAVAGFVALRQYGEGLARYDPIPPG